MQVQAFFANGPKLPEAWDQKDDWTGITSAAERRLRQNRLSQRAYRKRRHLKRLALLTEAKASVEIEAPESMLITSCSSRIAVAQVKDLPVFFLTQRINCPVLRQKVLDFLLRTSADWPMNQLRLGDLPTLTRLNALDALARNAMVMHIPFEYLESDDYSSLFNLSGPQPHGTSQTMPAQLCPTVRQKEILHHSWLDLFPMPRMRDNILRGIQNGRLDEDQLCAELCCDLLNTEAKSSATVIIWGDSWDVKGWEFSPGFFHKWGNLLQGCSEVLEATNYWREKRGEVKVQYVLNN